MSAIDKLLAISSAALSGQAAAVDFGEMGDYGSLGKELESLLRLRNGFYAFESALHVFSTGPVAGKEMTLSQWNTFPLWRFEYAELADRTLFFAEDAFGNQFCLHGGRVCSFDAETGEMNSLSKDIQGWVQQILSDYAVLTGHPLMHLWQEKNGSIPAGARLMPKIPFVLGGQYSLENLYALSAVSAMKTRGNLARQLKDLPDGSQVEFRVIE
jgi:hypothetical protein